LQVVDLIEFFLLKLSPILKKVTLLKGDRTVETVFCSKPLDLARSKPEFEPYRLHAVFAMLHTNMTIQKSVFEIAGTGPLQPLSELSSAELLEPIAQHLF
jgi:hypothetical protein